MGEVFVTDKKTQKERESVKEERDSFEFKCFMKGA